MSSLDIDVKEKEVSSELENLSNPEPTDVSSTTSFKSDSSELENLGNKDSSSVELDELKKELKTVKTELTKQRRQTLLKDVHPVLQPMASKLPVKELEEFLGSDDYKKLLANFNSTLGQPGNTEPKAPPQPEGKLKSSTEPPKAKTFADVTLDSLRSFDGVLS